MGHPAFQVTWQTAGSDLLHIGGAYLLALPIGWDREKEDRSAGLRTFPIVAVAACGFTTIGSSIAGATPDSYSRMLQGLITGIGFIGGGAILREKGGVTGMATAASVWNVGIAGAAVGLGLYHVAVTLTLINYLTLRLLTPLKHHIDTQQSRSPNPDSTRHPLP